VNYPRAKIDPYFDMIANAGLDLQPEDTLIQPYQADLVGVVTGVNDYSMVVPGVFVDAAVGSIVFDANEQALMNAEIEHNLLANDRTRLENAAFQEKLNFIKSITDNELKLRVFFEIFKDDRAVLDKTFLNNFLLRDKDGEDGLLKRLKLTV
jgi:hypothetical protein